MSEFVKRTSKRSAGVRLTSMAALGALVAGCSSEPPPPPAPKQDNEPKSEVAAFENVFECATVTGMSQEECTAGRAKAIAVAEQTAPRFEGLADCEAEFGGGGCVKQDKNGQSYFMPFIAGFVVGKIINNNRDYIPLFRRAGQEGLSTVNGYRLGFGGAPGKYFAAARAFETPRTVPAIKVASAASRAGLIEEQKEPNRRGWGRAGSRLAARAAGVAVGAGVRSMGG